MEITLVYSLATDLSEAGSEVELAPDLGASAWPERRPADRSRFAQTSQ